MKNCVFCSIAENKSKAYKIYEDEDMLCFLDTSPVSRGHCLLITKKHFENIFEMDTVPKSVFPAVKKISGMLVARLGATGINLMHASGKDAQQSVPHFHIHLVPRYPKDGLDAWPKSSYKEKNLEEVRKKITG